MENAHTKYFIGFFVVIMLVGMVAMVSFGLKPRAIPKIDFSIFKTASVVTNSLLNSIPQDFAESPIVFWGADPDQPFHTEILNEFLNYTQNLQYKFQAVVVDDSFKNLQFPPGLSVEQFSLKNDPQRFLAGLERVRQAHVHLLVVVPTLEASAKLSDSLLSRSRLLWKSFAPDSELPMGLVFTPFPRNREQEGSLSIPCKTGDQDLDHVASLGCVILQNSRMLYHKHVPAGSWVGQLQQVGTGDFLFMLVKD